MKVSIFITGFGCKVLAYDLQQHPECEKMGVEYVDLPELFGRSDIITLHCPLTPKTYHLVNADVMRSITYGRLRQRGSDIIEYYSGRARTDL